MRFLVEHGADVDAIGFQGKTALELAKSIGHIDVRGCNCFWRVIPRLCGITLIRPLAEGLF